MPCSLSWSTKSPAHSSQSAGRAQGRQKKFPYETCAILPNEKELSHRWRGRAWQTRELFHKFKPGHRDGHRLAPAIG